MTLFVTANVCEAPRHDNTIGADFAKIHRAVRAGVIMWQELGNDVYRRKLHAEFGDAWGHYIAATNTSYESPISFNTHLWELHGGGRIRFQAPVPGTHEGRFLTHAHLKQTDHPAKELIVSSRHYVARAWNDVGTAHPPRPDHGEAAQQRERQKLWDAANKIDLEFLTKNAEEGIPQVAGGDYNRVHKSAYPDRIAGQRVHHIERGLDWLHFIDGKHYRWAFDAHETTMVTHSDHPVVIQSAHLLRRKTA